QTRQKARDGLLPAAHQCLEGGGVAGLPAAHQVGVVTIHADLTGPNSETHAAAAPAKLFDAPPTDSVQRRTAIRTGPGNVYGLRSLRSPVWPISYRSMPMSRTPWLLLGGVCLLIGCSGPEPQAGKQEAPKKGKPQAAPSAAVKNDLGFTAAFEAEVKQVGQ